MKIEDGINEEIYKDPDKTVTVATEMPPEKNVIVEQNDRHLGEEKVFGGTE